MDSYCENVHMPDQQFKIKSFLVSLSEQNSKVHPHWHQEVEILYFLEGCAKQQVNEHFYTAEAGDIIIIARDQLHSTYTFQGSECTVLTIQFDRDGLLDTAIPDKERDMASSFSNFIVFDNPVKSHTNEGKILLECILEIHQELSSKKEGYQYIIQSMMYKIIGIAARSRCYKVLSNDYPVKQQTRKMLEKTFKLIDEAYFEDISLKKAALESNLSVTHFCRLFRKATGMTFNDYLMFYRVNRAEKLLYSSRTITEIAMDCGFGSMSSFIRNFKKYKNCTPSEIRGRFLN